MGGIRLAMIGCGRAAESLHLPAAAICRRTETTVLVDVAVERARRLAEAYGVPAVRARASEAAGLADAAVVALPHHLHAPITRELLESGLHVLVEKPLALTEGECRELVELARRRRLTLAVGMIRRSFPGARFVKRVLENDLLGTIRSVTVREGTPFSWDVASDFTFRRETGGGVLADTGIHVLDLLAWWFGALTIESYRDDAHGGVEADCEIQGALEGGAPVRVELSRLRDLEDTVVIRGSKGLLVAGTGFDAEVRLDLGGDPLIGSIKPSRRDYLNVRELFIEQLEDFAEAIGSARPPRVDGADATAAVALVERCRDLRKPLAHPWLRATEQVTA